MKIKCVVLGACVAVPVALAAAAASAQTYQLNVNTALTVDDPLYAGLEHFRDQVAERTDGEVAVRIFPGSALGSDEDVLEQARAGANVAVVSDPGRLALFVDDIGVLGGPYLAEDYEQMRKVVTSPLFAEWADDLREASGHEILSFNWWQGMRNLYTNHPVEVPADLAGVRMRTPGAPVLMETVRAMGATPTPMPWAEVYPALQQRVIDAVEAQYPAAYGSRLYEVTSHVTETEHFNLITGIVTSAAWFASLPEDYQEILKEVAFEAGDVASYGTQDAIAGIREEMQAAGMTISEIDVTPFREATAGVYEMLGYSELKERIDEMLAE